MTDARPLVLCLLGTDHHPFDRLVRWCDDVASSRPGVRVLVQHGATRPPATAGAVAYLGKDELAHELAAAHLAICHGGPGLISDVRAAGLLPLVVARDPSRGEHVDGHQQRFVARFATTGSIRPVDDLPTLRREIELLLHEPRGQGLDASADRQRVLDTVRRFETVVEGLLARR